MKLLGVQTSRAMISQDHDHDISFLNIIDSETSTRLQYLDASNGLYYVAFAGDPTIDYVFPTNTSSEITRLKKLANTHPYIVSVEKTDNTVTLYTDFDKTPTNKLMPISQQWVSPNVDYKITTGTTPVLITRFHVDYEASSVANTSYGILDNSSITINTPTDKLVYATSEINVNDAVLKSGQITFVSGNTTLSSNAKAGVIVVEYTD